MRHRTPVLLAGAGLAALAAAALVLPWRRPAGAPVLLVPGPTVALDGGTTAGWQVVGPTGVGVVVGTALLAVVATVAAWPFARAAVAAAGGSAVAAGVTGLLGGTGMPDLGIAGLSITGPWVTGPWITVLVGTGAAVCAVAGVAVPATSIRRWGVAAAAVVLGAAATTVVAGPPQAAVVADGPFVRLRGLDRPATLTVLDGAAAVVDVDGLTGAAEPSPLLARVPDGDRGHPLGVLGVAGNRVARWVAPGAVMVTGLSAGDPVAVRIRDVAAAGRVGDDGSVWLRAVGDPPDTVRRLVLASYDGPQNLAATYLPVVTIDAPTSGERLDVTTLRPVRGGAIGATASTSGVRIDRVTPRPNALEVATLVGGLDPTCGLTADPRTAFLPTATPPAPDAQGGVWFASGDRLVRLGPDGLLRAVAAPVPGPVSDLVATPDGALVLATGTAVWRLPDAVAALVPLPVTPAGCAAAPPAVGPPARFTPVANTAGDPLGVPLDVAGRWASGRLGTGAIVALSPDGGSTPLGRRLDGELGPVVPDGTGGVWWLETTDGRAALVHGRPGMPEQRFPAVDLPDRPALLSDLGGRPPLVGTAGGAFRIDGGIAQRVVAGRIDGGVVRPDGRGWVLADGRLLALDGDRVLGPVIDAGTGRDDAGPVVVQLAKGVAANRLGLPRAHLVLDASGRAVVVSDGVALAVTTDGAVTVVAQDPRLDTLFTVEGGLVRFDEGTLQRVDLP